MRALNVCLAIIVSIVLGVGVFELGLRLLNKGPAPNVLEFDDHLGWRKHADLKVHRKGPEYSVTLETNQFGLADDPMSTPAKPAGIFRAIALGDSFTQGFTVDRQDLFVDLLEKWWQNEGRKAEIVNAGCEAYSTDQEVVWLLDNGAKFQPDLVLLVAYENDLYWNGSPTYEARDTQKPLFSPDGKLETATLKDVGPRPWFETSGIGLLLFKPFLADHEAAKKYWFVPAGGTQPIDKEFSPLLTRAPDFVQNSLDRTKGALIALKQKCAELNARLVMVTIPSHSVIDAEYAKTFAATRLGGLPSDAWSADKPVDTFLALAKGLGIDALDPRAFLKERAKSGEKLYFDIDWHLNPAGNRALAEFLHGELERLAVFPADHPATAKVAAPSGAEEAGGIPNWAKLYVALLVVLSALFISTYKKEEQAALVPLKIGALLAAVFGIAIGGQKLIALLPPKFQQIVGLLVVAALLIFIAYKLGRRIGTIVELFKSFVAQGHWYLMPLIVVLLSIGSLLVVAASSPFVAPFIYTLF